MSSPEQPDFEIAKLEYQSALSFYSQATTLRRHDMAFVTTVQAAVLTVVGEGLLKLDMRGLLLSGIAVFVLLLGLNNERRLAAYMEGHMRRAVELEKIMGMCLLSSAYDYVRARRGLFSNRVVFPLFYIAFLFAWIVILLLNLMSLKS